MDALAGPLAPPPATMTADASRFTQVVARERSRLGHFIRGQVRDAADAEDILQDVWLEFYAATDAIEQAGAWLIRVARNRIVDRARKKKEEPLPDTGDDGGGSWLEENLPDPAAGPDAAYARSVLLGSIQAALQALPPEQRDVFVAHEIEGLSFADMASRWGVPQNTLLARKRYAVLALRARLQAEYGDLIVCPNPPIAFQDTTMRLFPLALIAFGVFELLKHFGLIDAALLQLFWPLLLIAIGVAMLARGPRWRADMHERMHGRWERRMHRHFGPGWAKLSDEERERFREGMQQWRSHGPADGGAEASAPPSARDSTFPAPPARPPVPREPG
jgi:RNA polymerase sigma factor (sigma-70 family)